MQKQALRGFAAESRDTQRKAHFLVCPKQSSGVASAEAGGERQGCSAAGSRTHRCCQLLQCPGDKDCAQGWAGQSFRFQRAAVRWKFQFAFKRCVPNSRGWVKTMIWVYPKGSESKQTPLKLQTENAYILVWVFFVLYGVFFVFVLN